MPEDMFRRVPLRLSTSATMVAICLCVAPALAQDASQPTVNDRQVQAFFNGIALDQQLAEQYSTPAPQASAARPAAAVAPRPANAKPAATPHALEAPLDQALDAAALDLLEAELDAAIAEDEERTTIAEVPPSPARTVLLVLASLALLAFAGSVLSMAMRELKKDALQRKRTYRRRVKRRDTPTPAHAN